MVLKLAKLSTFQNKAWVLFLWAGLAFGDGATLLKEFKRAQKSEFLSLEHRQKIEMKELKASQDHRVKEWKNIEKEKRHRYFKENLQGGKRREYMQDFFQRREGFLSLIKDERNQRLKEHEARRKAIREDQQLKAQKFKEYLDRNETPPRELWP